MDAHKIVNEKLAKLHHYEGDPEAHHLKYADILQTFLAELDGRDLPDNLALAANALRVYWAQNSESWWYA